MAGAQTQTQQQLYTHAAQPKAVTQRRPKYRDEDTNAAGADGAYPNNLMFDRRVVRGNTYAAQILPAEPIAKLDTSTRRSSGKKKATRQPAPRTPEPVDGRRHMDIQTDTYLEELTDTVPEIDNATQTDPFMDRPPTPLFVPAKTGVDAVTQIEQGDLFDFDFEVEPILEVLVGKVLEQGLMEVMEEEELAAMRAHQQHFEQVRNAELVSTQRMEAAEKRKLEEKERRVAQERERVQRERVVREKVAASTFARGYLNGIFSTTLDRLAQNGFFYDPVQRQVEREVMPWLQDQASLHLANNRNARQAVKKLVQAAVQAMAQKKVDLQKKVEAQRSAAAAYDEAESSKAAEAASRELQDVRQRATLILRESNVATTEQIDSARAELQTKAEAEAAAAHDAEKAKVEEAVRAEANAKLSEQKAQHEAAVQAASEAGGDPPEEPHWVDVDALVQDAVTKVQAPPPTEVTDGDVLSALMDKGIVTKEAIVHSLALKTLGSKAYTNHPAFA